MGESETRGVALLHGGEAPERLCYHGNKGWGGRRKSMRTGWGEVVHDECMNEKNVDVFSHVSMYTRQKSASSYLVDKLVRRS